MTPIDNKEEVAVIPQTKIAERADRNPSTVAEFARKIGAATHVEELRRKLEAERDSGTKPR